VEVVEDFKQGICINKSNVPPPPRPRKAIFFIDAKVANPCGTFLILVVHALQMRMRIEIVLALQGKFKFSVYLFPCGTFEQMRMRIVLELHFFLLFPERRLGELH